MTQARSRLAIGRTFAAFRSYNYRLYWGGQLVSLTGTWMQNTALSWLVLRLSHNSPLAVSLVSTFQFLPLLVFALFGGVIADRFQKRLLLVCTQSIMLTSALVLATLAATGLINVVEIYILAAVNGAANALDNPGRQAFVVEMVGPQDLPNAVALNSTQFNISRLLGPAVGGIAIAAVGYAACFYLNAASFLAVIGALLAMRPDRFFSVPAPQRGRMLSQVGAGLRYAVGDAEIAVVVILLAVIGTLGFNFGVFVPLIAKFQLHASAGGYGFLSSTMAAGSVVATLGVAYVGRAKRLTLLVSGAAFSIVLAALALSRWWALSVPLLAAMGLTSSVFTATASSRLQVLARPEFRGRVMSIYTLLFLGSTPVGALICGGLSEAFGVQAAIALMAAGCGAGIIAGLAYIQRNRDRLLPDSGHLGMAHGMTVPVGTVGAEGSAAERAVGAG